MPHQFRHYDVITTLEQHHDSSTYLVSTRDQSKRKAILKIFHKPAILGLEKREKFFQYLATLKHLNNPYLVPILDGDIEKGSSYVVSEYMAGGSLRARLDRSSPGLLPFDEALRIVSHVGQALSYLHEQVLAHGHLQPKHIFFDMLGHAYLSDIYLPEQGTPAEQELSLNTLRYLAPEQWQETTKTQVNTPLSDQYALCCVAYELFTGQAPFTATTISELKEQQSSMQPTPLTDVNSDLPDSVNKAILKGLEKDPSQRYPAIPALLTALQTISQITTHLAIPVVTAGQIAKFVPPNTPNTSDADVIARFTTNNRPASGTIIGSAQQALATFRHPFNTSSGSRQKRLWLGSALLTLICCLIVYVAFAIYSPPVSLTHGESQTQTQTAAPSTAPATKVVHTQATATATPISTPTAIAAMLPTPTATAHSVPTPTPTPVAQKPTPTPVPTVAVATTALFSGQLSAQTGQRDTYASNFISQLTVTDVRIEADISSDGNGGGVAFRSGQRASTGYRFFIETNGTYELTTASQILARGASSAIKTGNDVSNHITIVAIGSSISISINAQGVISTSNGDYSSGRVGVMAVDLNRSTVTTCNFSIYAAG